MQNALEMEMNKATYKMHYRLLRLSFGRGKSASFHALAPSLIDTKFINKLAYSVYGCPLNIFFNVI
jgi:hypothetical protein